MDRIVAIIQARMGSRRLPGKVLADVEGEALLRHVVRRTALAAGLDQVVVATPCAMDDLDIHVHCASWGVPCIAAGAEADVLGRYMAVAEQTRADIVVRITADCPLIDPRVIDQVVWQLIEQQVPYSSNVHPTRTYPDGLDVEAFTVDALRVAHLSTVAPFDREHVTPYIRRTAPGWLQVNAAALGHLRWTVDTAEDLAFVREVYRRLAPRRDFSWTDVLALGEFAHRKAAA